MLYRILTEHKNLDNVVKIVSASFDGFTVIEAAGYWQGKPEKSLIIEIDAHSAFEKVKEVARQIKELNKQQAIMIQSLLAETVFV